MIAKYGYKDGSGVIISTLIRNDATDVVSVSRHALAGYFRWWMRIPMTRWVINLLELFRRA